MIQALTASTHKILDILVDVRQINSEAGSCLGTSYALVCLMKDGCMEVGWDEEVASIDHKVIINTEAIFDGTKFFIGSVMTCFLFGNPLLMISLMFCYSGSSFTCFLSS